MRLKIGVCAAKFLKKRGKKNTEQESAPRSGAGPGFCVVGKGDLRKAGGIFGFRTSLALG